MRSIWFTIIAILLDCLFLPASPPQRTTIRDSFAIIRRGIMGCGTTRKGSLTNRRPPEVRSTGGTSFTSRLMNINYPFLPIPYPWDYGNDRTFNLPDYNVNNW